MCGLKFLNVNQITILQLIGTEYLRFGELELCCSTVENHFNPEPLQLSNLTFQNFGFTIPSIATILGSG